MKITSRAFFLDPAVFTCIWRIASSSMTAVARCVWGECRSRLRTAPLCNGGLETYRTAAMTPRASISHVKTLVSSDLWPRLVPQKYLTCGMCFQRAAFHSSSLLSPNLPLPLQLNVSCHSIIKHTIDDGDDIKHEMSNVCVCQSLKLN